MSISNPTLKGRLLNLQKEAKQMKVSLSNNDTSIKSMLQQIHAGTEASILHDKIHFIQELLNQKLEQIDYKIRKHVGDQKERNNELVELIGIIKNQKARLQSNLMVLQQKIEHVRLKIGDVEDSI